MKMRSIFFLLLTFSSVSFISYAKERAPAKHLIVPNNPGGGLFACFHGVMSALEEYDRAQSKYRPNVAGVTADFKDEGLYYEKQRGNNWWQYYFEPIELRSKKKIKNVQHEVVNAGYYSFRFRGEVSLKRGRELVQKYIRVRKDILDEVNLIHQRLFKAPLIIGIHYRGTDKISEAPRIQYEKVRKKLDSVLKNRSVRFQIFVATDEVAFIDYMKEIYKGRVICADVIRSSNGRPLHFDSPTPYLIGRQAMIDCLLLSRCTEIIRTASNLGHVALLFNPKLKSYELSLEHYLPPKK